MNTVIHNPHDKVFKKTLSNVTLAKRFFKTYLPKALQQQIDLSSLHLEKSSFVDDTLSEHLTDLLYSVTINDQQGYLYLLLESQSTIDSLMAFRLLKYSINIMQQHIDKYQCQQLPVVYPLVYYMGARPASHFIPDIMDCFAQPELARMYFLKPFTVIDLQKLSDDELLRDKALAGFELLQKHIWDRNMNRTLDRMLQEGVFIAMRNCSGDYFEVMLKYTLSQGEISQPEVFLNRLIEQLPDKRENIMTAAQYFEQKGIHEAMQLTAMKMLKSGNFDLTEIAEYTNLSQKEIIELQNNVITN